MNVWCGLLGDKLIEMFTSGSNLTSDMCDFLLRIELPSLWEDILLMVGGQMYFQHDGARNITFGMWGSIYTNRSLTGGWVMAEPLHVHRGCQTIHLLITVSRRHYYMNKAWFRSSTAPSYFFSSRLYTQPSRHHFICRDWVVSTDVCWKMRSHQNRPLWTLTMKWVV